MTTQAGIDAAYATEINSCSFNADAGTRVRSRAQSFCSTVEVQGDVTINANLNVAAVGTFGTAIVVAGQTFRPQLVLIPGIGFISLLVNDTTPVSGPGFAPPGTLVSTNLDGVFYDLAVDSEKDSTDLGSPIFLTRD